MSEDDLKMYFPKYGDRVAILNFCQRNHIHKQSLIERLKLKIGNKPYAKQDNKFEKKKATRVVEIGWLYYNKTEKRYRQVRTKYGGGTRKVTVEKGSKCQTILETGKSLFFPNGTSIKGRLDAYECELFDFKNHAVDLDLTVQDMYNISKLSTLRFYLATTPKDEEGEKDSSEEFIPATIVREATTEQSDRMLRSSTLNSNNLQIPIVDFINTFNDAGQDVLSFDVDNDFHWTTEVVSSNVSKLILHGGRVFKDMLDAFQEDFFDNGALQVEMILPNGDTEQAEDLGGVLRDAFSEFFDTFYETCTTGTCFKVPYVRHDYGEKQWQSIAKVIKRAWNIQNYFPIKLAPVFVKSVLGLLITDVELIENFLQYICDSDSKILNVTLNNFDLVEETDLIEFFNNYESKWLPNVNNIKQLTIDIAHKELVQKPAFIAKCFVGLQNSLMNFSIDVLYENMAPTEKNILNNFILVDNELNTEMAATYSFLRRFIKESDSKTKESFLRFCTGSNIISEKINISFNKIQGIARAPTAHTCSCSLEIPTTYENFVFFRNEFNNVLTSKIWIMDMV